MIRRRRKTLRTVVALLATLVASTAIGLPVDAETGAPRTEAVVSLLAAGTGDDRHTEVGGEILTYDLATYRLNVSQNGADSVGDVVATVILDNGFFTDADPSSPGVNPPAVCEAGSSISADRTTLTCNLGPLTQGTAVAIDYSAMASGDITPGDRLGGQITVSGSDDVIEVPELAITGTAQVDVSKRIVSNKYGRTASGLEARIITFALEVRTAGPNGKGGLPLDRVTFTDNWANIRSTFPGARLITATNPHYPGIDTPVGLNSISFPKSIAETGDDPGEIIPNPGTWAAAFDSNTDTTVEITVEGFDNSIIPNHESGNRAVTSGVLSILVPESDVPANVITEFTNQVTNVQGYPRGGGAPVGDFNPANNTAGGAMHKVVGSGSRNITSAWVGRDYHSGPGDEREPRISGNWSSYFRAPFGAEQYSSGGHQRVYPGQQIRAESVAWNSNSLVTSTNPSIMTCTKFQQPVTGWANAEAHLLGHKLLEATNIYTNDVVIQYGTISNPTATSTCTNGAASWSTTRPASFNAVRAFVNASPYRTAAIADGRGLDLVLSVPVTVPAGVSSGDHLGFWNTGVLGTSTSTGFTPAASGVPGEWLGADSMRYNPTANSGDARGGDRVLVTQAVATLDKRVCGGDGSAHEVGVSDSVEFCITAEIEGNGSIGEVQIVDDALVPGADMEYVAGTATFTGATPVSSEPSQDSSGTSWTFSSVSAPSTIEVRFRARAVPGTAQPGGSWSNEAHIEGPGLPDFRGTLPDWRTNPMEAEQSIQFRSSRYQLNIVKSTTSPSPTWPNTPVDWDLVLTNQGDFAIGTIDLIDILPFNGDDAQDRVPPSAFTGTTGLTGPVTPTSTQTVWYSTADPAGLSSLPDDPSNDLGSGAAGWSESAPADLSTVTAVRIRDTARLDVAQTRVFSIPMAAMDNEAGDIYTNDVGAVVQEGEDGPILPIRSNDVTVTVQSPGLGIRKETELIEDGTPKPLAVGEENTYTISVFNTGGIAEPNAIVTDELRDGLEFVAASDGGVYDASTRTITWPGREAPVTGTDEPAFTYTVTVKVARPAHPDLLDETGLIPNTARVAGDHDCIPGDDEDEKCESTVTNPPRNPHIWQDKIVDRDQALPGNVLTYTVTVGNDGDATATSVVAHDVLPDEVTFDEEQTIEVDRGDATYNGDGTITWTIGDLDVDETVTMTFTATINDGKWDTQFVNRVTSSHDPGDCIGSCEPPRVENPCEDDPTASCAPTETPLPSLRQDKVVDLGEALPGDLLTYTVSITNEGTVTAEDYEATDELPEGVTFESATHGGVYDDDTRTIAWSFGEGGLPTLEAGERVDIIVTATIDDDRYSSEFVNRFVVDPPDTWPPTNVDNPCVDEPEKSCAVTVTPDEPPAPVDPADPPKRNSPLPRTGAAIAGTLALGLSALATGSGLLISRRRRTTQ